VWSKCAPRHGRVVEIRLDEGGGWCIRDEPLIAGARRFRSCGASRLEAKGRCFANSARPTRPRHRRPGRPGVAPSVTGGLAANQAAAAGSGPGPWRSRVRTFRYKSDRRRCWISAIAEGTAKLSQDRRSGATVSIRSDRAVGFATERERPPPAAGRGAGAVRACRRARQWSVDLAPHRGARRDGDAALPPARSMGRCHYRDSPPPGGAMRHLSRKCNPVGDVRSNRVSPAVVRSGRMRGRR